MATWWVASTVKDDERRLIALADLHLSLGAMGVTYFLDTPEDPFPRRLAAMPGVRLVFCDDRYWTRGRPEIRVARQRENVSRAYRECPADWLLHIDSDEAVYAQGDIAVMLGAVPAHVAAIRLPVLERICGPADPSQFDGLYRVGQRRNRPKLMKQIYRSEYARFLRRGLLGHHRGKCFYRAGVKDLVPGIHDPNEAVPDRFAVADADAACLLHRAFDDWRRIESNINWRLREVGADLVRAGGWSGGIYNLATEAYQGRPIDAKAIFDEIVDPPENVKRLLVRRGLAVKVRTDRPFAYRCLRDIYLWARGGLVGRGANNGGRDERSSSRRAEGALSGRG